MKAGEGRVRIEKFGFACVSKVMLIEGRVRDEKAELGKR